MTFGLILVTLEARDMELAEKSELISILVAKASKVLEYMLLQLHPELSTLGSSTSFRQSGFAYLLYASTGSSVLFLKVSWAANVAVSSVITLLKLVNKLPKVLRKRPL